MSLANKVVVILGASSGIGEGIAYAVASQHPQRLVLAARRKDKLDELAGQLHAEYGTDTAVVPTDATSLPALKSLITSTIHDYGRLDVFVNSAGVIQEPLQIEDMVERLDDLSQDALHTIIQTNFVQVLHSTRWLIPHFRRQRHGILITISSRAGKLAYAGEAAYCATKAGVDHMTRSLDEDFKLLRKQGMEIYAFTLGPGFINTAEAKRKFPHAVEDIEKAPTPREFGKIVLDYLLYPDLKYSKHGAVVHLDTAKSVE